MDQEAIAYHNKRGILNEQDIKCNYNAQVKRQVNEKNIIYSNLGRNEYFVKIFAAKDFLITWENDEWQIVTFFLATYCFLQLHPFIARIHTLFFPHFTSPRKRIPPEFANISFSLSFSSLFSFHLTPSNIVISVFKIFKTTVCQGLVTSCHHILGFHLIYTIWTPGRILQRKNIFLIS